MEDKQILALYRARDEAAITRTAEKYGAYCRSIARNVLSDEQDVEEIVNDAWLAAWNSIPPRKPDSLSAYLGKLTRNRAIDRWRRSRREKRGGGNLPLLLEELEDCLAADDDPALALEQRELAETVNDFLAGLSKEERNVFLCRYWYFDGIAAISDSFGFSQAKVKSMLHRTRKKLRHFLETEGYL